MIRIRKYTPEELEELREDVSSKLRILRENTDDEKTVDKIDKFSSYLDDDYKGSRRDARKVRRINRKISFYERFKKALHSDINIDPGRLMGLTDGIFGMVMTLLVFGIALPELEIVTSGDFFSFLTALMPTIGVTIVSFVLISSFWIYHHEFIRIKKFDMPYLWVNIIFLICISFIPFTTSLIGKYSHFFLSEALFGLNIFLTITVFLVLYYYADSRSFLEKMPSKEEKKYILHTFILIMILTVAVNLLDFNVSRNFIYLFLLVPVISTIRDLRFKMKS